MRRLPGTTVLITAGLAGVVGLTGCGSSSSSSTAATTTQPTTSSPSSSPSTASTAPADPAAATAAVKKAYVTFFSSNSEAKAEKLLEDGNQLSAAFKAAQKLKGKAQESVKVHSVTFTSATTAGVKYTLFAKNPGAPKAALLGKPPAYADGQAVLQNGKWVVAKATFCGLVSLTGTTPAGC